MSVDEIRDFIFENYYRRIEFFKENSYYSIKRFQKQLACKQTNRKKYLILAMLKNTINHLLGKKN